MKLLTWTMEKLRNILHGPAMFIIPVAAACMLALPSIFSGLGLDDYFARAVLVQGDSLPDFLHRSPLDEFSFTKRNHPEATRCAIERGIWPWWTSANYTISFCRPLASLMHWCEYTFFKDAYWLMHLHSILWYAALILAATFAYRRFLPLAWIAGMAALLYALDSRHAMAVAYLNNRHALITTFFSILCLICYDRWRRDQDKKSGAAACLFYCIGLLAGESTVAICAYLFSYAVFIEKGPLGKKLAPLLPFAGITIIWRIIYVAFSFSAAGTSFYTDPLHDTASFIAAFPLRIIALLLSQFTVSHAALTNFLGPNLIALYCTIAVIVLLTIFYAVKPLMESAVIRFFGFATVLSMIPFCATLPDDRLLTLPGFGAMGIIASFLAAVGAQPSASRFTTRLRKTAAVLFLIISFAVAPVQFQSNAFIVWFMQKPIDKTAETISKCRLTPDTTIVLLNAPMDIAVSYVPFVLMERGLAAPPNMLLLSAGRSAVTVKRIDDHTLCLHLEQGLLGSAFERIFRGDYDTIRAGDTFNLPNIAVTVDGLTKDRRVSDLTYVFKQPLESSAHLWFYCTPQGLLMPFTLPAAGREVTIHEIPNFVRMVLMPREPYTPRVGLNDPASQALCFLPPRQKSGAIRTAAVLDPSER